MTPQQIEKFIDQEPFQPFRILLENGEQVTVSRPRKASVSGDQIAMAGATRFPDGREKTGLRLILIDRIVSATRLNIASET